MIIKPNMSAEEVQNLKDNTVKRMGSIPKMSLSSVKCAKPTENGLNVENYIKTSKESETEEQRNFYEMVGDFLLQKKQRQVIERNLF